jgi:hypothetical protein
MNAGTVMDPRKRAELIEIILAAAQAVVPHVSADERSMLAAVIDGMLRERAAPVNCD